jgi:hypothetical protein
MRDIYEKLIAPDEVRLGRYDSFGLTLICSDKKYAHFGPLHLLLKPTSRPRCSFTLIPRAYYPVMHSIATAKKSPYRGIFNFK